MTPIPVPHRWLGALLGVTLLLDAVMALEGPSTRTLLTLPGAALFAAWAWLGTTRPAIGATAAALTLTVSSVVMRAAEVGPSSIGLSHILITELVGGVMLVVLVVWRCPPVVASACVTALVVSCLASMVIRQAYCEYGVYTVCPTYSGGIGAFFFPTDLYESLLFGFILLAGAIAAGVFLRRSGKKRVETEMGALVRKQWPLGAALGVLTLVQLAESDLPSLLGLAASVVAGLCAFFGTRYPLRNAYITTGAFLLASLFSVMIHASAGILPFTGMAASMALIAYVIRYVPLGSALWASAALTGALLVLIATQVGVSTVQEVVIYLLFLLLVAVVTGWYFRARDRERSQTVKAAVTSAQQGERIALARELHDVVAHHVTGIVVQAQAALLVAERNPDVALPALERIERSGTAALTAMRTLVGSLREGTAAWVAGSSDATGDATTDLAADLHAVVEDFTGPRVELDLNLPAELPHEMGRSVLRLVQESLTNVGKHAPDASVAHVRVAGVEDTLHVQVRDDGRKRPADPVGGSGGYGLVGMRERVELLGGRFEAGPSGYVGWNVEAWLPLRKEES
ncbi:sensor histidine kinase [Actinophytocola sp.]|uniref:sensor histidine kinase n=1 Tax=Actinophytocola sp. TaxID=1872138 RepID=UPI003899873E